MQMKRVGLAGLLSGAALLAGAGTAYAQQVISMAPGVVLVLPAGTAPAMPDPVAMMQQMDAQMAQMNAMMQAQLQQASTMPAATGSYSSVVVTSFTDGTHSCTEQISYPSANSAEKIQVSETGNACASLGVTPGAQPVSAALHPVPLPATQPAPARPPALVVADNN